MPSRRSMSVLGAAAGLVVSALPAFPMGYDSLACPELAERRIEYFTNNGFCNPAKADAKDCKPIVEGSDAELPEAVRTQVIMIVRTETRKECSVK